jgi:hypothetical protein
VRFLNILGLTVFEQGLVVVHRENWSVKLIVTGPVVGFPVQEKRSKICIRVTNKEVGKTNHKIKDR